MMAISFAQQTPHLKYSYPVSGWLRLAGIVVVPLKRIWERNKPVKTTDIDDMSEVVLRDLGLTRMQLHWSDHWRK